MIQNSHRSPTTTKIKNEAKYKLNTIKTIGNLEWGVERITLKQIHNSMILSVLENGSILYEGACNFIYN